MNWKLKNCPAGDLYKSLKSWKWGYSFSNNKSLLQLILSSFHNKLLIITFPAGISAILKCVTVVKRNCWILWLKKKEIFRLGIQKSLVSEATTKIIERNKLQTGSEAFIIEKSRTVTAACTPARLAAWGGSTFCSWSLTLPQRKRKRKSTSSFLHLPSDLVKTRSRSYRLKPNE